MSGHSKLASEISVYLHSKECRLDFKPSEIQGLMDGTKGVYDKQFIIICQTAIICSLILGFFLMIIFG